MAAHSSGQVIIFCSCSFYLSSFFLLLSSFSSPNLKVAGDAVGLRRSIGDRYSSACWVSGNRATARVVFRQPGFSFSVIVDLLAHEDRAVQTVTGAALAAFSYNIASNQRLIARCAAGQRLTFAHFSDILRHGDELQRANAAFQVIVLSVNLISTPLSLSFLFMLLTLLLTLSTHRSHHP